MKRSPASTTNGLSCGDARRSFTASAQTAKTPRVDIPKDDPAYRRLLHACCPVVSFHDAERYFPTSVEAFLDGMQIMHGGRRVADATPSAMARYTDAACYLGWKDEADFVTRIKPGRPLTDATAPVYTHIVEQHGFLYLTYSFFYGYNGPLSFFTHLHQPHRTNPEERYWYFLWPHFGEHIGDWEHVTVEIDLEAQSIINVFFSAYDGGAWHAAETLTFEDQTHVVVRAALHSHTCYPALANPGISADSHYPVHDLSAEAVDLANTLAFIWSGGAYLFKTIQVVDVVGSSAKTWRPWRVEGGLVAIDAQPWLAFEGSWSPTLLVGFDGIGITTETVELLNRTGVDLSQALWLPLEAPTPSPVGYTHEALNEVATTPRFLSALPPALLSTPGPRGPLHQRWWTVPEHAPAMTEAALQHHFGWANAS